MDLAGAYRRECNVAMGGGGGLQQWKEVLAPPQLVLLVRPPSICAKKSP